MDVVLGLADQADDMVVHINYTCPPSVTLRAVRVVEVLVNSLLVIVGGPLNLIVLVIQLLTRRVRGQSTPGLYMSNLYLSNLLTLCLLPFVTMNNHGHLDSTLGACKFLTLSYYTSCTAGFATVAIISVDRYRVINRRTFRNDRTPLYSRSYRQGYFVITAVWLTSFLCASPASIYTTTMAQDEVVSEDSHTSCVLFFTADQRTILLAPLKMGLCVMWGLMPIAVLSWFYFFFYRRIYRSSTSRRQETLRFIAILMLSFLLLQIPFVCLQLFDVYALLAWEFNCQHVVLRDSVAVFGRMIPEIHCMLNPILYAIVGNQDFASRLRECWTGKLWNRREYARNHRVSTMSTFRTEGADHAPTTSATEPGRFTHYRQLLSTCWQRGSDEASDAQQNETGRPKSLPIQKESPGREGSSEE